jgi:hypothetical protein
MNKEILSKSLTGRDFLRLKNPKDPNIDEMLDWRNRLNELRKSKKYPDEWYQFEIDAVDEILNFLKEVNES